MNGENGQVPVDTGIAGGLAFSFVWEDPDPAALGLPPLRYGRVDVDYGGGFCDGVIRDLTPALDEDGDEIRNTWVLLVTVGPEHAGVVAMAIQRGEIGVRVRS